MQQSNTHEQLMESHSDDVTFTNMTAALRTLTIGQHSKSSNNFRPFPRFPTEVRLQIWEQALQEFGGRMLAITLSHRRRGAYTPFFDPKESIDEKGGYFCKNSAPPTLLFVNRESREVARKHWQPIFQSSCPLYFNFDLDTLYFPINHNADSYTAIVRRFINQEKDGGIEKIQKFAYEQYDIQDPVEEHEARVSASLLFRLPSLREVTLITIVHSLKCLLNPNDKKSRPKLAREGSPFYDIDDLPSTRILRQDLDQCWRRDLDMDLEEDAPRLLFSKPQLKLLAKIRDC